MRYINIDRKKIFLSKLVKKPNWIPGPFTVKIAKVLVYPIVFASLFGASHKILFGGMNWMIILVFIINLIAVMAFFPILTKLKNLFLANVDIAVIFSTIVAQIIMVGKYSESLALLQVPYLVFASIAMILQFSITYMNK